jgi:hypothetical protein
MFKIGDEVRLTRDCCGMKKGSIGTIVYIDKNYYDNAPSNMKYKVDFGGINNYWFLFYFVKNYIVI